MTARKIRSARVRQWGVTIMEFLGYLALAALFVAGAAGVYMDTQFNAKVEVAYTGVQNVLIASKKVMQANNDTLGLRDIGPPAGWTPTPSNNPTHLTNSVCDCRITIGSADVGWKFTLDSTDPDLAKAVQGKKVGGVSGKVPVSNPLSVTWTFSSL